MIVNYCFLDPKPHMANLSLVTTVNASEGELAAPFEADSDEQYVLQNEKYIFIPDFVYSEGEYTCPTATAESGGSFDLTLTVVYEEVERVVFIVGPSSYSTKEHKDILTIPGGWYKIDETQPHLKGEKREGSATSIKVALPLLSTGEK